MQRNAGVFDSLGDSLGGLKNNFTEFFGGALEKMAPTITEIADKLSAIDFTGFGQGIGVILNGFAELANLLAGVAPLIDLVSRGIGSLAGEGKPMPKLNLPNRNLLLGGEDDPMKSAASGGVSALQRIGLGGGFGGGGNEMIRESRAQTSELREIKAGIKQLVAGGGSPPKPVPV